jgi:hypothetical protein
MVWALIKSGLHCSICIRRQSQGDTSKRGTKSVGFYCNSLTYCSCCEAYLSAPPESKQVGSILLRNAQLCGANLLETSRNVWNFKTNATEMAAETWRVLSDESLVTSLQGSLTRQREKSSDQ